MKLTSRPNRPDHTDRYNRQTQTRSNQTLSSRPPKSWRRQSRYLYLRIVRSRSSPKAVARGLAAGVFSGMFPLFGFQTIIALILAIIIKGNKLVAAIATWISNPLTYVPLYMFNFYIGKWLLGGHEVVPFSPIDVTSWGQLSELGAIVLLCLFLGCLVSGIITSVISYFVGLWVLRRMRRAYYQHKHRS
jgi:uncharacterized protein (DUF2062 family)